METCTGISRQPYLHPQALAAAEELHRQANAAAEALPSSLGLSNEAEARAFANQVRRRFVAEPPGTANTWCTCNC